MNATANFSNVCVLIKFRRSLISASCVGNCPGRMRRRGVGSHSISQSRETIELLVRGVVDMPWNGLLSRKLFLRCDVALMSEGSFPLKRMSYEACLNLGGKLRIFSSRTVSLKRFI